jgi:hypothetical protein
LGYENDFDKSHKAGCHVFRRFRNTFLKNFTRCPDGLCKFWLGHTGKDIDSDGGYEDMGDRYNMIRHNRPFRLQMAEECGFGFELPSLVPNVPNSEPQKAA